MHTRIPEGEKGIAKVTHFEVDSKLASSTSIRALVTRGREEPISEGRYCQLHVGGRMMMSDTNMEQRTNRTVIRMARGHVLISGLGVGMILVPILDKPEVTKVTVLEKYQDVIDLVSPHLTHPKLEIIQADVFDYRPAKGTKYDVIYHDIWPVLSTNDLVAMTKLHRKYGRYLATGGWQESWRRDDLKKQQKAAKTQSGYRSGLWG